MSYSRRKRVDASVNRSRKFAPPRLAMAISASKPLRSIGLGCHPVQSREFNEYYQQNGIVGAYHDQSGECVLESRKARNEVLKLRGMRDNDASYGDWSGNN